MKGSELMGSRLLRSGPLRAEPGRSQDGGPRVESGGCNVLAPSRCPEDTAQGFQGRGWGQRTPDPVPGTSPGPGLHGQV